MRPIFLIVCMACSGGPGGLGPGSVAPPGTQIGQEGDLPPCERIELPVADPDVAAQGVAYTATEVMELASHSASGMWVTQGLGGPILLNLDSLGARQWNSQVPDEVQNPPPGYCQASGYVLDSMLTFETEVFAFTGEVAVYSHLADAFSFQAWIPATEGLEPPQNSPDAMLRLEGQFLEDAWAGSVVWMDVRFEPPIFVESGGEWSAGLD